jgi:hypothetical protein
MKKRLFTALTAACPTIFSAAGPNTSLSLYGYIGMTTGNTGDTGGAF